MEQPENGDIQRFVGRDANIWNEFIGPVYNAAGLGRAFGITPAQLDELIESKAVLPLTTSDGLVGFPANHFDAAGTPIPHLAKVQARLMQNEFMEEWTMATWLNHRPPAWDGSSAIELLQTDWAEEVIAQAGEDRRSPLSERTERAAQTAIARPILDRFVELVADLPVDIAEGTLFVTRETEVLYGVFAMSVAGEHAGLIPVHFEISGEVEATAKWMADEVRRQKPWRQ